MNPWAPLGGGALTGQYRRGELAFLSACKTATPGKRHLDEAITLSTAMRYSGRRHVIGTLWSVYDDSAATVSAETYRRILQDGPPQADQVAEALHHATRAVRDAHPSRPSMWSQFVHTGL